MSLAARVRRVLVSLCLILGAVGALAAVGSAATWSPFGEAPFYKFETQSLTDRSELKVNVATGNLLLQTTDVVVAGTGLPLVLERSYNSQNAGWFGDAGSGTVMSVGRYVQIRVGSDGSTQVFRGPSGYETPFRRNTDGTYRSPTGVNATLTPNADNTWTLKFHATGVKFNFNAAKNLASIVDRNGNDIVLAYDNKGVVSSITDTQDRVTTLDHGPAGHIRSITDPAGRVFGYHYTGGALDEYTDPAQGVTKYAYSSDNKLLRITDPRANNTNLEYDGSNRVTKLVRVTNVLTGTGPTWTFAYNSGCTAVSPAIGCTVVTDPRGNRTTHHWDNENRVIKVVDARGKPTANEYDSDSNVVMYTDALSNSTQWTFDSDSRLTLGTRPTGSKESFQYGTDRSSASFYSPTKYTNAQGKSFDYAYDPKGNLNSMKSGPAGAQVEVRFTYNANGTVATATDAKGVVTTFSYDAKGNLTAINYPDPLGDVTLTYDSLSRVTSERDGKGQLTSYTYDALDRVTQVTYADNSTVTFTYDGNGNRTVRTDNTGRTAYEYDALNRRVKDSLPGATTISYAYDDASNLTSITDGGGTTSYAYNNVNLLESLTEPNGARTTFTYNDAYSRTTAAYPNGVTQTMSYDAAQRLTQVKATKGTSTLTSFTYTYGGGTAETDSDLRTKVVDGVAGTTTTYFYDAVDRLVDAQTSGAQTARYQYAYDANGNRTSQTINGATTSYSYNAANQITSAGGTTYSHDANGNMTSSSAGLSLGYNAKDQTTTMKPAGGVAETFEYAGTTQFERTKTTGSNYSYSFTNDILGVGSLIGNGLTNYYVRDNAHTVLGQNTTTGRHYYLFDGLGSVVALTDGSGNVVRTFKYDPFGNVTSETGTVDAKWRFAGAYWDGQGFYKMGVRWYDAKLGRWTQRDPLDQPLDPSGWNPYVYVGDDPINFTDPSGLIREYCSFSPDRISGIFNFNSECQAHDACYRRRAGRRRCDVAFLRNAGRGCGRSEEGNTLTAPTCQFAAVTYYTAIRLFGWAAY